MNEKFLAIIVIITIVFSFAFVAWYFASTKSPEAPIAQQISETSERQTLLIKYQDTQYGFNFSLPISWKDYSIVTEKWEGDFIGDQKGEKVEGPKIIIRHPEWVSERERQDIPIMIFTTDQWDLIQNGKISIGSAPIIPSELGRNAIYIFALPARYNYAFQAGWEEVEKIIKDNPLQALVLPPVSSLPKNCKDRVESAPVITSLSSYSGSIGEKIEIKGCNFSGFEGDKNAWIENSEGVKGILYGELDSTSKSIKVTLKSRLCQKDNTYSGLLCDTWLNLTSGTYKIYTNPWGKKSNEVTFTIR